MIIKCSSCGRIIGEIPPYGGPNDKFTMQVTYKVCNQCKQDFIKYDGYKLAPDHHRIEPCEP